MKSTKPLTKKKTAKSVVKSKNFTIKFITIDINKIALVIKNIN